MNGKASEWGKDSAGVPQGSILGPLFFFVYINDLTDNFICNFKLFADDTSLFTNVYYPTQAASDMTHDLDMINNWAHRWRMSFNPDPTEQGIEVTFSRRKTLVDRPIVLFKDIPI